MKLRSEADNWMEQFEDLQLKKEVLTEEKNALERQMRMATKEIRSLKELLNQKEVYARELVQTLTQAQEDLRASADKIQFLESYFAPLKTSFDASEAEKEELRAEVDQWEKDYEALEDKLSLDVSWAFLNTRFETLIEDN
ncbi:uncharacterized protein [Nicotiana tomentosiformis]|uniref:uncharacterized protein n=1 Tax=Nicotiana tomentosiformis TaxID=4098 RepID=UPI00388CCEF6